MSEVKKTTLENIREYLLKIKEIVLRETPRLEEMAGAKSNNTELEFLGELGVLSQKGNAIRVLFQPFQLDDGRYIKLGIMNNYIKLFNIDTNRPIIIPFMPTALSIKDDRDAAEEELIFGMIASQCEKPETFQQIVDLHNKIFYGIDNEMIIFTEKPLNN